ncbi:DMT family transporter [Paludibacterium yongneupense]|uniref:DMT family transporter n=1 Tax=Paludibacterium yongneupense TaxID=400061 RepID=UPI000491E379|nr:DMT family transporter [Paludibacterium yongneupense]
MRLCLLLALLNGMLIALGRSMNGQLSLNTGPFQASLWNHMLGFAFLSLIVAFAAWPPILQAPAHVAPYLGGVYGALFVAVNSHVFTRLGAMRAALLVISGQMLSAVLIDCYHRQQAPGIVRCSGVAILLLGMCISSAARSRAR